MLFAEVLSLELTVPETELLELSVTVNVLVVRVVLSTTSLNVALKLFTSSVIVPFDGEVEETVGTVVSITNELIFNVTLFPAESVTVIAQFE